MEELLLTCKYKSSNNIIVKKEDQKFSFGNFIKDEFWDNENEKENIQLKPCRKRILSFNNEFQLVPLLRKVSCEPDPTCGKSNISKILLTNEIKTWFLRWIWCTWSKNIKLRTKISLIVTKETPISDSLKITINQTSFKLKKKKTIS